MKGKVFLVHWNLSQAEGVARELRSDGWEVDIESKDGARAYQLIKANPPNVVVVYLTHLPSHGRETAHALRSTKATRNLPIVFVDGKDEAVARTREKVADALFTTALELKGVLASFAR